MKVTLITLGNKMPDWVNQGCHEYLKRLGEDLRIQIVEIPLLKRSKSSDLAKILVKEAQLISQAIPDNTYLIALDSGGQSFTSEQLAEKMAHLQHQTGHICLLIGGPEGLSQEILNRCQARWSLSKLTLPHPLVRIVILEALYRAWSINHHHPYHK